jgi:hypothetical protein
MRQQQTHHQPTTTVAIFGTGTLSEDILARLLERESYHVKHLEASPSSMNDELLEGIDIVLVAPGLKGEEREAFLKAARSTREIAAIPVLPLSAARKLALLDELSASASWRTLLEELIGQIGAILAGAATSARALVVEGCGAEPPPAAQTDAAPQWGKRSSW